MAGKKRTAIEKRIEEIRMRLRHLFGIKGNPLPFVKQGDSFRYQAVFKIECADSYHT